MTKQSEKICPHCKNSWYVKNGKCNKCGESVIINKLFYIQTPPVHKKRAKGKGWDKKAHKVIH